MIDRLCRLVGTPSVSREEGALADAVADELARSGLEARRSGHNVWCALGDAPRPRLLLNSHLDTVPPGDGWGGDPWTVRREGDRLIGLGANDAKGCVAAMIEAVLDLKADLDRGEALGGTVVLALTAQEEISGDGLATIVGDLSPIDAALVGEPTGLTPMIAQRGLLILVCTARGRSAHPANTPPGSSDNAVPAAARDITRLREFDWGPKHALLGRAHGHVTMIEGGIARNVIPDRCTFTLDIRTTPGESHADLVGRLSRFLESEVSIHSDRLVPVETARDEPIVRAVRSTLPDAQPAGSRAMSDMVFLEGVPAVKIGPGQSVRSHTPDEFVTVGELEAGARAYADIVRAYFKTVGVVG